MKPILASILLLGLVATMPASSMADDAAKPIILRGQYTWDQTEEPGDISGAFSKTGDERWDVKFDFTANGEEHTWSGTATGRMGGAIEGTVVTGGRTYRFEGKFEDGVYRATHAMVEDGKSQPMGTLTLK